MIYDSCKSELITEFLDRLDFIDDINPLFRITVWARGNFWYEVTPTKLIRNKKTPAFDTNIK